MPFFNLDELLELKTYQKEIQLIQKTKLIVHSNCNSSIHVVVISLTITVRVRFLDFLHKSENKQLTLLDERFVYFFI